MQSNKISTIKRRKQDAQMTCLIGNTISKLISIISPNVLSKF